MAAGDEYRARAQECMQAAESIADTERKISLLELAQRWMWLANQLEVGQNRSGLRGDALLDDPKKD